MEVGGAIEKLLGILAGTFLSLVFVPPKSIQGFFRRTSAALVFGWIHGHIFLAILIKFADVERTEENVIVAWSLAAFTSWVAMGAYIKYVKNKADKEL